VRSDPRGKDCADEEQGENEAAGEGEALVGRVMQDGAESRGVVEIFFHGRALFFFLAID
jgi:hypothetical protein